MFLTSVFRNGSVTNQVADVLILTRLRIVSRQEKPLEGFAFFGICLQSTVAAGRREQQQVVPSSVTALRLA